MRRFCAETVKSRFRVTSDSIGHISTPIHSESSVTLWWMGKATTADHRGAVGRTGELHAARRMEADGCRIIERNARTRFGEIDLIARQGRTLIFCEVKTLRARRANGGNLDPLESIGPRKRSRVRRLARAWLADRPPGMSFDEIRFDAVGVLVGLRGEEVGLEWVRGAF